MKEIFDAKYFRNNVKHILFKKHHECLQFFILRQGMLNISILDVSYLI